MKAVLLLEDEDRAITNIKTLIEKVEPQALVKTFKSLKDFSYWVEKAYINPEMPDPENKEQDPRVGEAATDAGRIEEILLMVFNHKLLNPSQFKLLHKLNRFFIKKELNAERRRIGVLFTAHEAEPLEIDPFMREVYDNILFKPLDFDVAKEKIIWAINAEEASGGEGLHKEKPHDDIEMLKEITVDRITNLGLSTATEKYIEPGTLGRYYCDATSKTLTNGVYGRCHSCIPHPEKQGHYRATFTYFALPNESANEIKNSLGRNEKRQIGKLRKAKVENNPLTALILDEEPSSREYLEVELPQNFENLTTVSYMGLIDFLLDLNPSEAANEAYADVEDEKSFFEPITLFYDLQGQTFIAAQHKEDEEKPIGFEVKELSKIKSLFMTQANGENKKRIADFFRDNIEEPLTLLYREKSESRFYTIEKSEVIQEDDSEKRAIHIRYALSNEIAELQKDSSRIPKNLAMIIVSEKYAKRRPADFWASVNLQLKEAGYLKAGLEKPVCFAFSRQRLSHPEIFEELSHFEDIFYSPFDSNYMLRKMKYYVPELMSSNGELPYDFVDSDVRSYSGVMANVKYISEVGLTVLYPREMALDSFRRFVVRFPEMNEQPRLAAKNVYVEEPERGSDLYLHHFVFFGQGEQFNFALRNWLMEQYSLTKQEEEKEGEA